MFSTTEITSHEIGSDNVIHQRLYFAYTEAAKLIGEKVLEIGCGAGRGLNAILQNCQHYTAIDKNEKLVKHHSETYPQHTFICQQIPPLQNIPDNSFDFVITFQVIEHIENDQLFVQEIQRVLKPNGKAIITTPNIKLSLTRNPWHVREYEAHQLQTLLQKYFSKVELKGVYGSQKVLDYYEKNKASVKRITQFDILNLQYRLPRQVLQVPYDLLNRLNRNLLMKKNQQLVNNVAVSDYFLTDKPEISFDFFAIVEK